MNIGIDLGTTNSALAYIDSTDEADYPTIHVLDVPQYVAPGRIEALPHAAVVSIFGRSGIHRRLCARAGRDRSHQVA